MLGRAPTLMASSVWHKRTSPLNEFSYQVYYLALNARAAEEIAQFPMRVNRRGLLSYHDRDHGYRSDAPAYLWAEEVLAKAGIATRDAALVLVTMPRILGYVFNPVSFWLLLENPTTLRAVIAEVNNTFGETHSYVLAHADGRAIESHERLVASKHFHVSPFLNIEGDYIFGFRLQDEGMVITIDHTNAAGEIVLKTSLAGHFMPYTRQHLWRMCLKFPLVTLKVIALIHYQALCLMAKKVRYKRKPKPPNHQVTLWRS